MSDQNNTSIGNVQLIYNEQGKLQQGYFTPTMCIKLDKETIEQLYKIPCSKDSNDIKDKAELIMSLWFNKITEIELADRLKYKIESNVKECIMYPNTDKVKSCNIEFSLQLFV